MNKKGEYKFTQIPMDKTWLYEADNKFSIIHLYILERVRSFQAKGQACYISNEQLSKELNFSISTVKRAIKLLIDKNFLYVKYGDNGQRRTLYIYDKEMERYKQKKNTQPTP